MPIAATIQIIPDPTYESGEDRAERRAIASETTMRDYRGIARDVMLENLSPTGCLVRSPGGMAIGTRVRIGLAGGGIADGAVVRGSGRLYGCAFDVPLSDAIFAQAFSGHSVIAGPFAIAPVGLGVDPVARWPRPVRFAALLGGAVASWVVVVVATRAIF